MAFLRGQKSASEEQDLQSHLSECVLCRERLEDAAANQDVWNDAKKFFGDSTSVSSIVQESFHDDDTTQHSWRLQQVFKDLLPTDEPESLGRIGTYEIVGVVGTGGMGVVLKAHDRSLDRIVAIKVMAPHLASNGSARRRFAREAKAAAAVLHPNVIAIHSVASQTDPPYLVMPYVRGLSLQKRIDSEGPLPLKDTLRIGAQIAAGLAAAHDQGLVHRDIKPANILLEEGVERVTITDFGLARTVDDASMTCSGVIAGTPQYMSPEQTRGETLDARSDLFSLGSVLYAMSTGRPPFRAETTYGVLHRIANDTPTPVCEVNSEFPCWFGPMIERLMAKQPNDRFASAAQVADMLEGCLAHVQQPTAIPLPELVQSLSASTATRQPPAPHVPVPSLWSSLFRGGRRYVTLALIFFAFFLSGIFLVVEMEKGTLTIASEAGDVPIRILRGKSIVDRLMVTKSGTSLRVAAGDYVIEIDDPATEMAVDRESITLRRGNSEHVRIRYLNNEDSESTETLEAFRFETPESLMEFVAERQNQNDLAGVLSCWTDEPVRQLAASYLLLATMQLVDYEKNPTASRPDRYFEQIVALKQILTEEIHDKTAGSLALALGVAHAEIADKNDGKFEATVEASTLSPHVQFLAKATADQIRNPRSFVTKINKLHDEFLVEEVQSEPKVFQYRLKQDGDRAIATEMQSGVRSVLTKTQAGWRIGEPFGAAGTSDDPQSLERTVDRVNWTTWEARQTLFSPSIEDLTVSQLKKAILDAAAQYRKAGKSEIALALEKSEKSNRWVNGLEFSDMITSRHDGFVQIRANLHLRSGGPDLQWVPLSGIELRHSRDGWSSKSWGDIYPPIAGSWKLISVEKNGETLHVDALNEWSVVNARWMELEIDLETLTTPHDQEKVYDFSIDYDAGALPQFTMRIDGDIKYSGILTGNGYVDDTTLSVAVDTEGTTTPVNWDSRSGNTTILTYRRATEP